MTHISKPAKQEQAPKRIDHIIMLRARLERSIRELEQSPLPAAEDALKAKRLALQSYNQIIREMEARPQRDHEPGKLALPSALGGPLSDSPYGSLSFDAERIRKLLGMADCDFEKPRGSIHLFGERASIFVESSPDKKKPAVD